MGGTIREEEDIEGLAIPQKKFQMHQTINSKELKQRILEEENELLNVGLNMHSGYEKNDMDVSVIETFFIKYSRAQLQAENVQKELWEQESPDSAVN